MATAATTYVNRPLQAKPAVSGYATLANGQPLYATFPTALHHDESGYDASGYEPCEQRHPVAPQHVEGMQGSDGGVSSDQFDMLPPLASTHASWQALHDYAQSHASEHGYALSINTTAKNRSRIKLACVCFGQPKNTHKLTAETRIRKNRVSYKTGCKMWIEGKKQEDGKWFLRVGEPQHNHPGRPSEGWAVQRKRTWGVVGGRIGVGGVTAQEEARQGNMNKAQADDGDGETIQGEESHEIPLGNARKQNHSLDRGGMVWEIVEQEMLRKGEPNQGLDRGVGRTVEVLKARLPGIHIFKRDVYNIRAQIKRARRAAGQQLGNGGNSDDDETQEPHEDAVAEDDVDDANVVPSEPTEPETTNQRQPVVLAVHTQEVVLDPLLVGHGEDTTTNPVSSDELVFGSTTELGQMEQMKKKIAHLEAMLHVKTKEEAHFKAIFSEQSKENTHLKKHNTHLQAMLSEKDIENAGLRTQIGYMTSMGILPS